jgi:F-type H+-transporting ATPase subunit a
MKMITNLFSMFDPSSSYNSTAWALIIAPLLIFTSITIKPSPKKLIRVTATVRSIGKEIKQLTKLTQTKRLISLITSIFVIILTLNTIAIEPFNFTITAHISITFCLRLSFWASMIINATLNSFASTVVHLTPLGTPNALINFIVIIEVTSQMIRPLTLAVRLMANIVAGHLLISLLRRFSIKDRITSIITSIPIITLIALERGVAIIQAYVITILSTLYYNETF